MIPPPFPEAVIAAARDDAKAYLRIVTEIEDALIGRLAASALALGEAFTGQALIARDWDEVLAPGRVWTPLAAAPVNVVDTVESLSLDGTAAPIDADLYAIDIAGDGQGWIRSSHAAPDRRLRVTYNAGAAAGWADLAPPVAQGIVLLIAYLFDAKTDKGVPPAAVSALWRPWRRMRLTGHDAR